MTFDRQAPLFHQQVSRHRRNRQDGGERPLRGAAEPSGNDQRGRGEEEEPTDVRLLGDVDAHPRLAEAPQEQEEAEEPDARRKASTGWVHFFAGHMTNGRNDPKK